MWSVEQRAETSSAVRKCIDPVTEWPIIGHKHYRYGYGTNYSYKMLIQSRYNLGDFSIIFAVGTPWFTDCDEISGGCFELEVWPISFIHSCVKLWAMIQYKDVVLPV